jgi:hypothetical protein
MTIVDNNCQYKIKINHEHSPYMGYQIVILEQIKINVRNKGNINDKFMVFVKNQLIYNFQPNLTPLDDIIEY